MMLVLETSASAISEGQAKPADVSIMVDELYPSQDKPARNLL